MARKDSEMQKKSMSKPICGKAERYLKISLFGAFFIGACAVQFIAFAKGYTPFPK